MVSCAINGLGLALVIPRVQSLVADYHPSESRGKAFGFMFFTASCGRLLAASAPTAHLVQIALMPAVCAKLAATMLASGVSTRTQEFVISNETAMCGKSA